MKGIHFITNEKGEKIAVQIDLDLYAELWEHFSINSLNSAGTRKASRSTW